MRKQLDTVVSPKSKLTKPVRKPKAAWVEPTFVADVEYRDITSEGLLRASSFKGLSRKWEGSADHALLFGSAISIGSFCRKRHFDSVPCKTAG
ncbi:hypothetical protein [Bradyrhizobium sp. 190]|uniref:ATP dependent DNA ligase n=1 Tax=Bradyrhizobium sp. 190 TaxID=2782658 RepID=UPI001FFA9EE5|nr:hypothetical protein [Bradyrhizobium sp. 190]